MKKLIVVAVSILALFLIFGKIVPMLLMKLIENSIAKEMMIKAGGKDRIAYDNHRKGEEVFLQYRKNDTTAMRSPGEVIYAYPEEQRNEFLNQARAYLEKAVRREPDNATYHEDFAQVLEEQKEYDFALKEYEEFYLLGKNDLDYFFHISGVYRKMGRETDADVYRNKYIELAKECTDARHIDYIIGLFIGIGRFDEAREQIERVRKTPSIKTRAGFYMTKDRMDFYESLVIQKEQLCEGIKE